MILLCSARLSTSPPRGGELPGVWCRLRVLQTDWRHSEEEKLIGEDVGRRRDKSAFISIRLFVTAQMSACRLMQRAANLSIDCQMWVMLCRIWSDPHVKVTPEQIHFPLFTSCYVRQKKTSVCVWNTHPCCGSLWTTPLWFNNSSSSL